MQYEDFKRKPLNWGLPENEIWRRYQLFMEQEMFKQLHLNIAESVRLGESSAISAPSSGGKKNDNLITDGLLIELDASKSDSYPGSGTTWFDISGNSNDGNLINGVSFDGTGIPSMDLDGTNDYVGMGLVNDLTGLIDVTISAFLNPDTVSGLSIPLSRYNNITYRNGWQFVIYDGVFNFGGRENTTQYLNVQSPGIYSAGQWYNLVGVKSGNVWSFYINGELKKSSTLGTGLVPFANNNMYIGTENAAGYYLNGKMNSVLTYGRALTQDEVLQNYNYLKSRYGL